jgi:uncharacterized protein (TIGR02569 family)
VLEAFGAVGIPAPLVGGRSRAWHVGEFVLKRADLSEDALAWQAEILGELRPDGFRIAPPRQARDGGLVVDGWTAWQYVEGRHEVGRWLDVIEVGRRFHVALAAVPRPTFLDRRDDGWAIADRVAWGEIASAPFERGRHMPQLLAARRPIAEATSQVVHGDLTGNVLFAEGLAPAIIDVSPYWRPPGYASAIVVADALVNEGADASLVESLTGEQEFPQLLIRALIFRVVCDVVLARREHVEVVDPTSYDVAVELAIEPPAASSSA